MKATILVGHVLDHLRAMPDCSVQCVVTSPPYWGLRDYGTALWRGGNIECDHRANGESRQIPHGDGRPVETDSYAQNRTLIAGAGANFKDTCGKCGAIRIDAQLGLEKTPEEYIAKMVGVFREVRRVLRPDGTLWLNIGDSYNGQRARAANIQDNGDLSYRAGGNAVKVEGLKSKDLVGIPWMLAFALRADGWYLRQDIIWSKPNPMPESVTDRCTKAHEYLFLLTKSARYYCDMEAILEPCSPGTHARLSQNVEAQIGSERANGGQKTNGNMKAVGRHLPGNTSHKGTTAYLEGDERMRTKAGLVDYAQKMRKLAEAGSGVKSNDSFSNAVCLLVDKRNKRSVWEIATQPYAEAHFATYPEKLVEPCILAGSKEGDTVLDPFCGSGTTGAVALRYHRNFIGIELNPEYAMLAEKRIGKEAPMFNETLIGATA